MVMKAGAWGEALDGAAPAGAAAVPRLVVPTPSGALFTQEVAARYAREPNLLFACGRYEGMDARVLDEARTRMPVEEVSIGDYVLAGGEAAVLVMVEATCRLLPGVLGNAESAADDSFGGVGAATTVGRPGGTGAPAPLGGMAGLLEGPVYTKPRVWRGRDVPAVLLSGNHAAIARWRRDPPLRRTARMRPELAGRPDPATPDARARAGPADARLPLPLDGVAH